MLISNTAKRNIALFTAAFLLLGVFHNLLWQVDFTYSFSSLYGGVLVILWAITVQKRITDDRLRLLMLLSAIFLLLHFFMQFLRYDLFDGNMTAQRYMWYVMYIPLVAQPLLFYFTAVNIYRPMDKPLPRPYYLFIVLGVVFVLGALTNDLHFSFKAFPAGVMDDNGKEVSGWLYYAAQVFIYGLYALALAIILKKNHRYVAQKYRWMTLVPLLFGAIYFLLYPLDIGHRFFNTRFWQMGDIMAFCIIGTLEACIQVGMIPENRGYEELFSAAHFPAVILDAAGRLVYQTAAGYPFQQGEDVKIVSHPISGGNAEYLVDIKQVRSLNQQLAERSQQIETRNAYLAEEARIKKERAELETKNRLYENISNIVKPQLAHIDKLLNARSGCGNRELAKIAVLKAYIKRRSNMELLSEGGTLTVLELSSAVSESLDYIQLTGANAAVTTVGSGAYPASMIVCAYEHIEAIIEDCMDSLSDMIITIRADKADLTVRIMLRADSFSYKANDYPQSGKGFSRKVTITKDDPDLLLLFTFTEGGGGA